MLDQRKELDLDLVLEHPEHMEHLDLVFFASSRSGTNEYGSDAVLLPVSPPLLLMLLVMVLMDLVLMPLVVLVQLLKVGTIIT